MTEPFPTSTESLDTEDTLYAAAFSPLWDPWGDARILAETTALAKRSMMSFVFNEIFRQDRNAEVRNDAAQLERIARQVKAEAVRIFLDAQLRRARDFLRPASVGRVVTPELLLDLGDDRNQGIPEVHQSPGHAAATSASAPNAPPASTAALLSVGVVAMAA